MKTQRSSQIDYPKSIRDVLATNGRAAAILASIVGTLVGTISGMIPPVYQATTVLGVISSGGATPSLGGAAALLGGALNMQGFGTSSTGAIASYLLTSRMVLDSVISTEVGGEPIIQRVTGRSLEGLSSEDVRRLARRQISVATSRETGFLTMTVRGQDPQAVAIMAARLVSATRTTYSQFQREQARTLRMSQQARVDSFARALVRAEDVAQETERRNASALPGTRGELDLRRQRRERDALAYAYEAARAESESALARELLNAASVVVLEPGDQMVEPLETRPIYRGILSAAVMAALVVLTAIARYLISFTFEKQEATIGQ